MNGIGDSDAPAQMEMDCLAVGGVANGLLMRILHGAETIELGKPSHVKPLVSSKQAEPEIERETDIYNVCTIYLPTLSGQTMPFGLAVVEGKDPAWAVGQITLAYVQMTTQQMLSDNSTKQ